MSAPYDALAVANEFLDRSQKSGRPITPMQLLKLVYFAHGWHLALEEKPLVKERFEAWKFGPVNPPIYHEFKRYGMNPVGELGSVPVVCEEGYVLEEPRITLRDRESRRAHIIIDAVWRAYSELSGSKLSAITHEKNSAWWKAWYENGGKDRPGTDLDERDIQDEFCRLVTAGNDGEPQNEKGSARSNH